MIIVSLYSFGSLVRVACIRTLDVSQLTNRTQAASTLIAPALPEIARDLHIKSSVETQLTLSTFILSVAFGPLFFGPLCEIFGRVSGKSTVVPICSKIKLTYTASTSHQQPHLSPLQQSLRNQQNRRPAHRL